MMNEVTVNNFFVEIRIFKVNDLDLDKESADYDGCNFMLNNYIVKYRKSKITPKKTGQFVTLWKRDVHGKTIPFDEKDNYDFYLIFSKHNNKEGFFFFPKKALLQNNILSSVGKNGKRGFRVYPFWDKPINNQAFKTKLWQNNYFIDLTNKNEWPESADKFSQLLGG